jgi:hypothetical protein
MNHERRNVPNACRFTPLFWRRTLAVEPRSDATLSYRIPPTELISNGRLFASGIVHGSRPLVRLQSRIVVEGQKELRALCALAGRTSGRELWRWRRARSLKCVMSQRPLLSIISSGDPRISPDTPPWKSRHKVGR